MIARAARALSTRRWWIAACVALGCAALTPAPGSADHALRVLFIGNSYTRFNDLPRMVERIAESVPEGPRVDAHRETHGGYNLRRHWRVPRVRRRVERGDWDAVVLQPHSLSAFRHLDETREYARRFQAHAAAAGARVVLFETWARHPESPDYRELALGDPGAMHAHVERAYRELGQELGASVAPVGNAWRRALEQEPGLALHRGDHGTHPARAGTYLSACVVYGTLTGIDPREARWRPFRLRREQAERIREIAAQSLGPLSSAPHAWPAAAPAATSAR